jgi:hypothetical protein
LPTIRFALCWSIWIPTAQPVRASPRTVTEFASISSPDALEVLAPSTRISGLPEKPGCVVPSTTTGPVMAGSGDAGAIVCEPLPMLKSITSLPACALALWIAERSEPGPESAAVVTIRVDAPAFPTAAASSTNNAPASASGSERNSRRDRCFVLPSTRPTPGR